MLILDFIRDASYCSWICRVFQFDLRVLAYIVTVLFLGLGLVIYSASQAFAVAFVFVEVRKKKKRAEGRKVNYLFFIAASIIVSL